MRNKLTISPIRGGYEVRKGRLTLGTILTAKERSGRYAFVLGCDRRKRPRTYRGMKLAVKALLALAEIVDQVRQRRLGVEETILAAWASRPPAAAPRGEHRRKQRKGR